MTASRETFPAAVQAQQLVHLGQAGQLHVAVSQADRGAVVLLTSADGTPRVQLTLHGDELVLDCLGGRTRLRTQGALTLEAEQLTLSASQDLRLHSGGDLHLQAAGRLDAQANAVEVQALQGDVCVTANYDVLLEGERVRMNA